MKKMMTVLAACAVTSLALADSGVVSQNIVGYQTLNLAGNNYNMLAVNWEKVGGGSIAIQNLVNTTGLTQGGGLGTSDNILVWNPATTGYKAYYLYTDGMWYEYLNDAAPTTDTFAPGTTFWMKRKGAVTTNVTFSGQVLQQASAAVTIAHNNYTQIGNPYATVFTFNGTYDWVAAGAVSGGGLGTADNILVWNPATTGYKAYYLYNVDGKWYEYLNDAVPTTDGLPIGSGAWYKTRAGSDWTLTFTKPY